MKGIGTPFLLSPAGRQKLTRLRDFASKRPIDMLPVVEQVKTPEGKRAHLKRMRAQTIQLTPAPRTIAWQKHSPRSS